MSLFSCRAALLSSNPPSSKASISSLPNPLRTHILFPQTLNLIGQKKTKIHAIFRRSDNIEQQRVGTRVPDQRFSTAQSPSTQLTKVYAGFSIYKGKAALKLEPKSPEFSLLDSGAFKVSKDGFVSLQFSPAVGARQYDWNRKQVFSLSICEIGALMALGSKDACEFFHDPFMGKSEEGQIRKILKVEPLPDGTGHFFNLHVQNQALNVNESFYVPIVKAELVVLQSLLSFITPYLLGWHAFAESVKLEDSNRSGSTSVQESEWSR